MGDCVHVVEIVIAKLSEENELGPKVVSRSYTVIDLILEENAHAPSHVGPSMQRSLSTSTSVIASVLIRRECYM